MWSWFWWGVFCIYRQRNLLPLFFITFVWYTLFIYDINKVWHTSTAIIVSILGVLCNEITWCSRQPDISIQKSSYSSHVQSLGIKDNTEKTLDDWSSTWLSLEASKMSILYRCIVFPSSWQAVFMLKSWKY